MAWPRDDVKLERVRALMAEQELDALVVRAPDNVLYLTNFWGMKGYEAVVFPRDGETVLICLEASEDDVEFAKGTFSVKGSPEATLTIQEVALATFAAHNLPDGMEPSLDSDYVYDPENFSYPHGTHLCAVEIDTETGFTKIRKYVCVDDIGKVVNPVIVEGQVHGGLAQGIAQALYEEAVYDDQGTLVTGSFVDYLVPSAADLPSFVTDRTETPAISNELGVKGVGEAGTIASTPAIVNGVIDAVRHKGVADITMPLSPHRVWQALQGLEVAEAPVPDTSGPEQYTDPMNSSGSFDTGNGGQS